MCKKSVKNVKNKNKNGSYYRSKIYKQISGRQYKVENSGGLCGCEILRQTYPELFDLGLNVTLREVLDVGQLQVHLSQPHQDAISGRLKLLSLTDKVLHI